MKVIIAGSRSIISYDTVKYAIELSGFEITEVVSGHARGVDQLGEKWAKENDIPVKIFPTMWSKYGTSAGYIRNEQMADYVGYDSALLVIWDGKSPGTRNMIHIAEKKIMRMFIHYI